MLRPCLTTLTALALLGDPSSAQHERLAGVTWDGWLVHIDPATGHGRRVRPTGYVSVNSMAKDSHGTCFAIGDQPYGSKKLFVLDPYQGTATFFRYPYLVQPTAIAFSPEDVLFAVDTRGSVDSYLYYYDPTEPPPDAHPHIIARCTNATGQAMSIYGLTFSATGELYAWSTSYGLVLVDRTTAFCTDVNPLVDGTSDIQTLTFSSSGALYAAGDRLYTVDPATGAVAVIGSGDYSDVRGAEFYPLLRPGPMHTSPGPVPVVLPRPWFQPLGTSGLGAWLRSLVRGTPDGE